MSMVVLVGKPVAYARARHVRGSRHVYNPRAGEMDLARMLTRSQWSGRPIEDMGVHVRLLFVMPMPHAWSKKLKLESEGAPHKGRPDIDNLAKFVLDVGNGILWTDDCHVCVLEARKIYGREPRTEILVTSV